MSASTGGKKSASKAGTTWLRIGIIAGCLLLAAWELPFVILPALGVCRVYTIPTSSMSPTLLPGDHVLVNELAYKLRNPRRGDMAVFDGEGIADLSSAAPGAIYVKRVAGLPGERIAIRSGEVFINGEKADELSAFHHGTMPGSRYLPSEGDELLVPQDSYFVLGDNSRNSADSRLWGFIPRTSLRGCIVAKLWHGKAPEPRP